MSQSHDLDTHLVLRTDKQDITGTLCVGPKAPISEINPHALMVFLESKGIPARLINQEAIKELVKNVHENPGSEQAAEVAHGRLPRHGAPQVLQWEETIAERIADIEARKEDLLADGPKETNQDHLHIDEDDEDGVNHYAHSAFIIVDEAQTLGTISPPDPGEDGEDIFGNPIPAKKSPKPNTVDQNSIELTDDNRVIARIRGRLRYSAANQTIERVLNVEGDVGFATGHIDFPGPVYITGGIKDRFVVASQGNTSVAKLVEAATINSKRDILIARGVAGRELAVLSAVRNLEAGYLEACTIHALGDCTVKREITNCVIDAFGTVRIPTGAIRGGRVAGAHGIEAGVLGSAQEVLTNILVGSIPELDAMLLRVQRLRKEAKNEADRVRVQLESLIANTEAKTAKVVERQMGLEFEITEHEARLKKLDVAAERIAKNILDSTTPTLTVHQRACGGVVVHLRGHRVHFKDQCNGPFELRVDEAGKPIIVRGDKRTPASDEAHVSPSDLVAPLAIPKADEHSPDVPSQQPDDKAAA